MQYNNLSSLKFALGTLSLRWSYLLFSVKYIILDKRLWHLYTIIPALIGPYAAYI